MKNRYILYYFYLYLGSNYAFVSQRGVFGFAKCKTLGASQYFFLVLSFKSALEDVELRNYLDFHNADSFKNPWRDTGVKVR